MSPDDKQTEQDRIDFELDTAVPHELDVDLSKPGQGYPPGGREVIPGYTLAQLHARMVERAKAREQDKP